QSYRPPQNFGFFAGDNAIVIVTYTLLDLAVADTDQLQKRHVAISVAGFNGHFINAGLGVSVLQVDIAGHILAYQIGVGFIAPINAQGVRAYTAAKSYRPV